MKITGWCAEATTAASIARCARRTPSGTWACTTGGGPAGAAASGRRASAASAVALTSTAITAFQPKVAAMKALSHCQVSATISTGGAAKDVKVPPIEMLTKSTPSAAYFSHSGRPCRKTSGASISAASVIAAGSVMSEPTSGTRARHNHRRASAFGRGSQRAQPSTSPATVTSTGREAATTMMTKTNSGSVYWRDSA